MAHKKKTGSPGQLEIRQCETSLSAERFRDMLEALVSTEPAFNNSFLMGKQADEALLQTFNQHFCGSFSCISYVGFIGHSNHQYLLAVQLL